MKKVLLVTGGLVHPPFTAVRALHQILKGMAGYQFQHIHSLQALPDDLADTAALVLYFHHVKIPAAAINIFEKFVRSGGGVLAVHSATASSKKNEAFADILGGKFSGHGPVGLFPVTPVEPESEIFPGIPEFQVRDELYRHDLGDDIVPHFTTWNQGELVPLIWTRIHGIGRVCYTCPGHRTATFKIEAYQRVLHQGLKWVTE